MDRNYRDLLDKLNERQNPENFLLQKSFSEELRDSGYQYADLYIKRAMQAVDAFYTQRSIEAGNKVMNYLKTKHNNVDYEFQGSVMTNTHIRGFSDIDLLTISNKSYCYDAVGVANLLAQVNVSQYAYSQSTVSRLKSVQNAPRYEGDAISDLKELRNNNEYYLQLQYSYVDISRPKSIKVSLTSPRREVDVVAAGWFKGTDFYLNEENDIYRGIEIYDKEKNTKLPVDYPFLSIFRINQKDSKTVGRLKKMIRFLKTIKCDSNVNINLSSFDINAICYAIEEFRYYDKTYIELLPVIYFQFNRIITDSIYRSNLYSVDGKEKIFKDENKIQQLQLLLAELNNIQRDLINK